MEALSVPSYHVVMSGHLGGGDQSWSTGFWVTCSGSSAPTQNDVTTNSGAFGAYAKTLFTAIAELVGTGVKLEATTAYFFPAGATKATLLGIDETDTFGNNLPTPLPMQLALVATLRSSTPGRSGRGRMYFPATGDNANSAGQTQGSVPPLVATNLAEMFTAINGSTLAEGGSPTVVVASHTKGVAYPVVSVLVDSKYDTQRRREDKMSATSSSSHVV